MQLLFFQVQQCRRERSSSDPRRFDHADPLQLRLARYHRALQEHEGARREGQGGQATASGVPGRHCHCFQPWNVW